MTPEHLATKIEGLTIVTNERFVSQVVNVQNRLYNKLLVILKDVELDSDGFIKQSSSNRKVLNDAISAIDESFAKGTPYQRSIEQHLEIIPSIDELNTTYFETISSGFTPNRVFIKSLQKQTISSLENSLLNAGLESQVKSPLVDILNRNVNAGGSYSGFLKEVQDYVKGTSDIDGRLLSYSRNIVRDALSIYARAFQQSATADLKLEWYLYAGGLIDKSRPFCIERAGQYFHESEIKKWASLEWAGKMRGTTESSIFYYCGGYACGHELIPIHISAVPKIALDRINT